ncbi:MAG TPA: phenylalanine--tRNA ligase subunit beta [Micropepsaceae bacterium]|nr:phenylalanine--tRNA ligase subunit beta [Micropepsaceae bacterium]
MKFSVSWLKEHLDTAAGAAAIADAATNIGLEVESIDDKAAKLAAFTVARVVSAEPHPNADRLRVCRVDTGKEVVQVVCGAPNARAGLTGVFAPPGTWIPGSDFALKIATIRGVESRGMLCSERELQLSEEHDGIIELGGDFAPGMPAATALGLNDAVIDVAVTPNRGDCTSVHGVARDLAAANLGVLKLRPPSSTPGKFESPVRASLDFPSGKENACPLFAGRVVRGLRNGPSPQWLQERLKSAGLRPISALVDVTNYVSHGWGRPLHAFDAAKLQGHMRARFARQGETILALDGKEYALDPEMTVIADDAAPRSIGGVMGGDDSGCTEATTEIFLESALFDPVRTARTGRMLGIVSDARYRFERGVDPEFVIPGLELATQLILEICGGEASALAVAGRVPEWRRHIRFDPAEVNRLGGFHLADTEIAAILKRLGFELRDSGPFEVIPPSWRADVHDKADLVEEVVRIHGLGKVPATPMSRPYAIARPVTTEPQRGASLARRALAARGFAEAVHYSFIPRAHAAMFGGGDDGRQLENPISADLDSLRPSLMPSLLAAASRNQARGLAHVRLFELGVQFESGIPGAQSQVAAGIRAGEPPRHWRRAVVQPDAFAAKADALAALDAVWTGASSVPVKTGAAPWYHPGRSGTIATGPKPLAWFGELHPRMSAAFDLKGPVSLFEIFLDAIPAAKARSSKSRPKLEASDLMPLTRDFAFVVDGKVTADQVVKAARSADRKLIEAVELFDVYQGSGVAEGKKSLAIAVTIQPRERTLTEAEIEAIAQKIVSTVAKATGGVLRS